MKHALVLLGHADPDSFNARLAHAYTDAWRAAGGSASLVTLSDLAFDPVTRHGYRQEQPLEPDLAGVRDAIDGAQHLAWFFPMYWATQPAIVRGFVDRLFTPGWAFRYPATGGDGLPEGLLRGRSARVVVTMDSPSWWYTFGYNRAIHGSFVRGTLSFVGLAPVRTTMIPLTRKLNTAARDARVVQQGLLAREDLGKLPDAVSPRINATSSAR
jgi:NAD(P)H dehydrogenase (quinone)